MVSGRLGLVWVVEALRGGPLTRSELAKAVGLSATGGRFKEAVAELIREGLVVNVDGDRLMLAEAV
jgi:hypothetical protein